MTKGMREGLGVLCVAAALLVIGLAARSSADGGDSVVGDLGVGVGCFGAIIGLAWIAAELFRKQPED